MVLKCLQAPQLQATAGGRKNGGKGKQSQSFIDYTISNLIAYILANNASQPCVGRARLFTVSYTKTIAFSKMISTRSISPVFCFLMNELLFLSATPLSYILGILGIDGGLHYLGALKLVLNYGLICSIVVP